MFLLRRSAARAFSAAPSKAFVATPRSIFTLARARHQQPAFTAVQRRFASDDAPKTPDNFAQTAAEAPLEDGLTPAADPAADLVTDPAPAEDAAPADPTDESATVGADAIEAVAQEPSRGARTRQDRPDTPNAPNKCLYVGNLFYEVTADQLARIFTRFGEVENTRIVYDPRGMSRGFGYVEFKNLDDAQTAVDNLHQQIFEGRNLVCAFHRPRTPAFGRTNQGNQRTPSRRTESLEAAEPSTTLFIGNMSFDMSDKDLNDMFRDIRNVVDVRVAIDRRTGQPRGFAHADFVDVASAKKAKEALNGKAVYGRQIRVDFSKSAPQGERRDNRRDSPTEY